MIPRISHFLAFAAALFAGAELGVADSNPARVDYASQIKPILAQNCYQCHGITQQKHSLRLDTAASARLGGDSGPAIIPGNPDSSLLIRVVEGRHDSISRMPYKRAALEPSDIALIRRWIAGGAQAPADEQPQSGEHGGLHWSFVPPVAAKPPQVGLGSWPRGAIDQFVLAKMESQGLAPSPEADKTTLIRRLGFDLTGLPPSVEEVDAFLADSSEKAYEAAVDRLLQSPHYGEKWARHWLDMARYADSNGYSIDAPRSIWSYRDWVIQAFNDNMPFDQFVVEQLAGDMLPAATSRQKIATGFHRNTMINEEGGVDKEQFRIESIFDRVATTGSVFLGLTVGCAQCHDHKFDPVTQKEYYQLFAFLNNADEPSMEVATPAELAAREKARAAVKDRENELKELESVDDTTLAEWVSALEPGALAKLKPETRAAAEAGTARTAAQRASLAAARAATLPRHAALREEIAQLKKSEPKFPTTLVMAERDKPRESFLFIKGDFTRHGDRVAPGVPASLHPLEKKEPLNRLDLAQWMASPDNPLLARVAVNRFWLQFFGAGLVETDNDFGTQGTPPSHPALLDWLAVEFMNGGWDVKAIHRQIVTSATYRQSSRVNPTQERLDPRNKYLSRQNRVRLDAELVRDAALSASGVLSPEVGGPSVFPPQPEGVMSLGQSNRAWKTDKGEARYRRGMYTFFWRATPHPALTVFDAPDANSSCTRRLRSNTPLQSLTLLNDDGFFEMARRLASRVQALPGGDQARLAAAFRLCASRPPDHSEMEVLQRLLESERQALGRSPEEARDLLGAAAAEDDLPSKAAWVSVARVLLNLDETITRE